MFEGKLEKRAMLSTILPYEFYCNARTQNPGPECHCVISTPGVRPFCGITLRPIYTHLVKSWIGWLTSLKAAKGFKSDNSRLSVKSSQITQNQWKKLVLPLLDVESASPSDFNPLTSLIEPRTLRVITLRKFKDFGLRNSTSSESEPEVMIGGSGWGVSGTCAGGAQLHDLWKITYSSTVTISFICLITWHTVHLVWCHFYYV